MREYIQWKTSLLVSSLLQFSFLLPAYLLFPSLERLGVWDNYNPVSEVEMFLGPSDDLELDCSTQGLDDLMPMDSNSNCVCVCVCVCVLGGEVMLPRPLSLVNSRLHFLSPAPWSCQKQCLASGLCFLDWQRCLGEKKMAQMQGSPLIRYVFIPILARDSSILC